MPEMFSTSPTAAMPSARATIATCDVGPALFEDEAAELSAVVVEQRRRAHGAGHQDGVVGQLLARRCVVLAHELSHQAVAEVVEVVQPLADVGIGDAQHAGAVVGLHALDAGFGG